MASSTSPIAMFELMTTGENGSTWGTKANTVFQILERVGSGVTSITMNAATKTLSTATDFSIQDWHYRVFDLVSATQSANFVLPSKQKMFGVLNSSTGSYTMTVKTATGGSVAVADGETAILYNDGTDVGKLFYSGDYQPIDADLTAIAALSSAGLIARTGAGTAAVRTLTGPAAGITVTNGDGVSGNPTLALANDLSALEGLASTGIAVRSASDTWVQRSIAGTSAEITVTNGDGVSGNPTLSLPTALTFTGKTVTGGTFSAVAISGASTFSGTTVAATTSVTTPSVTNAGTLAFTATGANSVTVGTNGSTRAVVDSSGNVSVTTAAASLYVGGTSAGLRLLDNGTNSQIIPAWGRGTGSLQLYDAAGALAINITTTYTGVQVGGSERVRFDNSGNVVIGTTSADKLLTVYASTDAEQGVSIRNESAGSSGGALVQLGNDSDAADGKIVLTGSGNSTLAGARSLNFISNFGAFGFYRDRTSPTVSMVLDSSGNVGINETSPDYKLDVNGTFGFTPGTSVTPVDNGDMTFYAPDNTTFTIAYKGSDGTVRTGTVTLS